MHFASQSADGRSTSQLLLQLTLHAPLHSAMQLVLSLFASHLASQPPSQSARQAASQSNLPGSTVHCPVQSATHFPLHSTLGSLLQLASQLAASFALHAARMLTGVHMTSQPASGRTTSHSVSEFRLTMSPQSERSARAVLGALAIPSAATALKHETVNFVEWSMGRRLSVPHTAAQQKACQWMSGYLNTARANQ
jgi:hypothetical protein